MRIVIAFLAFALAGAAFAQNPPLQDKPFAEHKLVLQLSDREPDKQALVLSVANNLLKAYDPDKIIIEVITFGPGIDLLREESDNRARVDSLIENTKKRLESESFASRAPAEVVAKEKEKFEGLIANKEKLARSLGALTNV